MKTFSIARRVVSLVLLVELLAALCVIAFAFFYERHAHFRSFDISLRGHADTVMGAVEDADSRDLGVMLDTTDLTLPEHDLFAVREEGRKQLGRTPGWDPGEAAWTGAEGFFPLQVDGHDYRAIRLHGVRVVDPMAANVRHPLTVLYAAPTRRVWAAVWGGVEVFALANGLLILVTALVVPALVRRSLHPLHALAREAGAVSAQAWSFTPPPAARAATELRPLVQAIEDVLARLERSFTQQRQFTGDAAHELKTAVAVVKSSIQLLEIRARTAAEYQAGLQRTFADCLRMEDLARNMLLLARVEEPPTPSGPVPAPPSTSLASALGAAFVELAPMADLRGVALVKAPLSGPAAQVPLAPDLLRSLLVNLLTNALQHSPPGAAVRAEIECTAAAATLRIADTGDGIPPAALPFVFDRFFRGDPSRSRRTGGTGLGLAICRSIVDRAHGIIHIESAPGKGTAVTVTLPAVFIPSQPGPPAVLSSANLQPSRAH